MASLYREKTDDGLIQRDTVTYTGESFYTHRVEEVVVYHKLMYFSFYYLGKGAMAA